MLVDTRKQYELGTSMLIQHQQQQHLTFLKIFTMRSTTGHQDKLRSGSPVNGVKVSPVQKLFDTISHAIRALRLEIPISLTRTSTRLLDH